MGGNLGDVARRLQEALRGLAALPGTQVEAVSSLYRTRPVESSGPDYLNAVAVLQSSLGPRELLHALLALELTHDRERPYQNAPRTLDLDLLWYGACHCDTPTLTLPHPRMMQRAFVLVPLAEVLKSLKGDVMPALPDATAVAALAQAQGIEAAGVLDLR
ncbi:MAG TPA: 2-amino-4-hydroxy-6-hydroxymethyldihydropteridine diphosphokinase [Aquabacterium sp.]|uniref:2-amino-4-hydroxy-6- hydroxymethyldihydropteridine diphosphokinase n=1 Tax=Aquabacterium sp. TaxID=1872578 RepID=UPI002E34FBDE|nr:2-amino-4-hydroxy-6-hydroxymethyldihydropteridine diphosphokinase [Aquabacterium sp.]HEX5357832.1 2-amino-4-hydroxy-6-hydroxymethyldihydropteridine diphosphokinase [Aquabacterium sp.]